MARSFFTGYTASGRIVVALVAVNVVLKKVTITVREFKRTEYYQDFSIPAPFENHKNLDFYKNKKEIFD